MSLRDSLARVDPKWRARARLLRYPAIGAGVATGAWLIGKILGPGLSRSLGESAGSGFARGVADVQAQLSNARGARFG